MVASTELELVKVPVELEDDVALVVADELWPCDFVEVEVRLADFVVVVVSLSDAAVVVKGPSLEADPLWQSSRC